MEELIYVGLVTLSLFCTSSSSYSGVVTI